MPDKASPDENVTVTGSRYQPAALGVRSLVPVMVGGVLSRLTTCVALRELPAPSVAAPVTSWPAPSVVTTFGAAHEATPESPGWSEQANVTVTSVLFHWAEF